MGFRSVKDYKRESTKEVDREDQNRIRGVVTNGEGLPWNSISVLCPLVSPWGLINHLIRSGPLDFLSTKSLSQSLRNLHLLFTVKGLLGSERPTDVPMY